MIADTSGLLAFFDASDQHHDAVTGAVEAHDEVLVVSPYVVAELDYIVAGRIGVRAEIDMLGELASDAYDLADFGADDLRTATSVIKRYHDQAIGVADASNVVLAARYGTRDILTLDHRHFDVLRPLGGGRFRVIP